MALETQSGKAFVAFTDISGFKSLMIQNKAEKALNDFYNTGYFVLSGNNKVQGLFISDCGILISRNEYAIEEQYGAMLDVVKNLNVAMLNCELMLTTSIAYGDFSYHNRLEFPGIEKTPIYGSAYLNAYLDNEVGKPKLKPGLCRILKKNLPNELLDYSNDYYILRNIEEHIEFYWMCDDEIDEFKKGV